MEKITENKTKTISFHFILTLKLVRLLDIKQIQMILLFFNKKKNETINNLYLYFNIILTAFSDYTSNLKLEYALLVL